MLTTCRSESGADMDHPSAPCHAKPQPRFFVARTLTMKDLNNAKKHAFAESRRWSKRCHADPAGPPFVSYSVIDMPGALHVEFAPPSTNPSSDASTLERGLLPTGEYAQIGFKRHFQHLVGVNAMLIGWARQGDRPGHEAHTGRRQIRVTYRDLQDSSRPRTRSPLLGIRGSDQGRAFERRCVATLEQVEES